jgi:predicted solute-binding protein
MSKDIVSCHKAMRKVICMGVADIERINKKHSENMTKAFKKSAERLERIAKKYKLVCKK